MLQQTQVKTAIPYFNNFVKKITSLKALSKSSEKKILKLWEGLGYYNRAKNLHKAAKIIVKNYRSKLPKEFDKMKKLPGVGNYTANALLALVYNQPRIPFDGNVQRVFYRLFKVKLDKNEKKIKKIINKYFFTNRNSDLAEALMEFGAIICKPANPLCDECNLRKNCYFFNNKSLVFNNKKTYLREKKYNVFCYLKKQKKEIALTVNKNLSFLSNFKIPETKIAIPKNKVNNGWIYLCNYRNRISNIKMDINLFYKFIKTKPNKYTWHSIDKPGSEFIPTFTKKVFERIAKVYS